MLIIPNSATVLMLNSLIRQERTLRLFANDHLPTMDSQRGDLVEVESGKGYAPVPLVPARWEVTAGKPPMATYPKVIFTFTEPVGKVFGYFVTGPTGALDWVERFETGPYLMSEPDDQIKVNPRFELGHVDLWVPDAKLLNERI